MFLLTPAQFSLSKKKKKNPEVIWEGNLSQFAQFLVWRERRRELKMLEIAFLHNSVDEMPLNTPRSSSKAAQPSKDSRQYMTQRK